MAEREGVTGWIEDAADRVESWLVSPTGTRSSAVGDAGRSAVGRIAQQEPVPTPAKATPHPYATKLEADLGQHVADGMNTLNHPKMLPVTHDAHAYYKGVQYTYNFKAYLAQVTTNAKASIEDWRQAIAADPQLSKLPIDKQHAEAEKQLHTAQEILAKFEIKEWNDDYYNGYASPAFFERFDNMSWRLKHGKSASAAVKAWLSGLTLGECNTAMCALEYDALRSKMGDAAFDHAFAANGQNALEISPSTPRTNLFLKQTEGAKAPGGGVFGNRPAKIGEWYYFCNHPKYLLKHPGGAWQGENAILSSVKNGVQYWSGLGASDMTEDAMLDEMVEAYNTPRDADDERAMKAIANGGALPREYDPKNGVFPDAITKADILHAPVFAVGQSLPGGFYAEAGQVIDPASVARLSKPSKKK